MPKQKEIELLDGTNISIWNYTESVDFIESMLLLNPKEIEFCESLNKKRKREWIYSRYVINQHIGSFDTNQVKKDGYGKPYIMGVQRQISISHSGDKFAFIHSNEMVGIDIQKELSKITRIAPKFINEAEWSFIPTQEELAYIHIIWGAKEAMYKAYGRKSVDFKKDMKVSAFEFDADNEFKFIGQLQKEAKYEFQIRAEKMDDFYLVYCIESGA